MATKQPAAAPFAPAPGLDQYGPDLTGMPGVGTAPAAAAPKGVRYQGGPPLSLVIGYVAPNTKRGKSAARHAKYPPVPFTLADALKIEGGPVRGDFIWDLERGLIRPAD